VFTHCIFCYIPAIKSLISELITMHHSVGWINENGLRSLCE
jgi:hypothetical protein